MCEKAYSDILPHFRVTSCLGARDILPSRGGDILPWRTRHPAFAQRIASQKSFFVRCKYIYSSASILVFPPSLHLRSSTLEQERNRAYVTEHEENVS